MSLNSCVLLFWTIQVYFIRWKRNNEWWFALWEQTPKKSSEFFSQNFTNVSDVIDIAIAIANLIEPYSIFMILKVLPMIWQNRIVAITVTTPRDVVQVSLCFSPWKFDLTFLFTRRRNVPTQWRSDWPQQQPHENPLNQKLCNYLQIWFVDLCSPRNATCTIVCKTSDAFNSINNHPLQSNRHHHCDWID